MAPPLPPPLPSAANQSGPGTAFVRPLALASLWAALAAGAAALLLAPLAAFAQHGENWQLLLGMAQAQHWPPGALWLLQHPAQACLWVAMACLPGVLSSLGLLRQQRWGPWAFSIVLVVSVLSNFLLVAWVDQQMLYMLAQRRHAEVVAALQAQRWAATLTLLGTALVFALPQLWLAWRLLQRDVRDRCTAAR